MDIPAIFLALETASLFSDTLLPVWLVLALVVLQVSDRGAVLLPCLLVVFGLVGIIVGRSTLPHVAFTVWVVAIFSIIILYLSLRGLGQRPPSNLTMQEQGIRLLIGMGLGIIAALLGFFTEIPGRSALTASAVWPLVILGILRFGTAKRGIEMGAGLLLVLAGIGVWLTAVNDSVIIPGVWAAGSIFLALATGWLTDRTEGQKLLLQQ